MPQLLGAGAPAYAAAFDGVVTLGDLQRQQRPRGFQLRALFVKPAPGNAFTVQTKSPQFPMVAGTVTTYPTRFTVHLGDLLALNIVGPDQPIGCLAVSAASPTSKMIMSHGDVDSTSTLTPSDLNVLGLVDISVVLEPDADHDGFGDASQDQCATSAQDQGALPRPDRAPDHREEEAGEEVRQAQGEDRLHLLRGRRDLPVRPRQQDEVQGLQEPTEALRRRGQAHPAGEGPSTPQAMSTPLPAKVKWRVLPK